MCASVRDRATTYTIFNDGTHSRQATEPRINAVPKYVTILLQSPLSILSKSFLLSTSGVGTVAVPPIKPVIAVMVGVTSPSALDIRRSVRECSYFLPQCSLHGRQLPWLRRQQDSGTAVAATVTTVAMFSSTGAFIAGIEIDIPALRNLLAREESSHPPLVGDCPSRLAAACLRRAERSPSWMAGDRSSCLAVYCSRQEDISCSRVEGDCK